jgi:hypothetical protein
MLSQLMNGARMGNAMGYQPSEVRAWAHAVGEPAADRGRLSYQVVTAYLMANPHITRGLAVELGVHISSRGRVSQATCEELAALVR